MRLRIGGGIDESLMSCWGQVKVLFSLSRHSNYSSYFYSILFFAADDRQNKNNPLFFFFHLMHSVAAKRRVRRRTRCVFTAVPSAAWN